MSIVTNSETVKSKYFTCKTSMDESLSDFKEAKASIKGPKTLKKQATNKVKKPKKHIKGQKDIRTALKGKKNELIKYTKEFDNVCKQAGVDVDSEQLQIAIALSKSLQTEDPESSQSSKTLSTQERVGKIRTTLQEYGFKVPEIKITKKNIKKSRKQYKLLLTTDAEKHQITSDKYSKVLFENLNHSQTNIASQSTENSEAHLYYLSTNVFYEVIKDNTIFYTNNLIEHSMSTGLLLRDWCEIPGRPVSPMLDTSKMNFNETNCSQNEIDVILSGTLAAAKHILNSKQITIRKDKNPEILNEDEFNSNEDSETKSYGVTVVNHGYIKDYEIANKSPEIEFLGDEKPLERDTNNIITLTQYRSCSPDIFDDEISSIVDNTKSQIILSQEHKTKVFTEENNFMDLTQCAVLSQNSKSISHLSQNATKRKSNDFMEITGCVGSTQPIFESIDDKIDLTQSPEIIQKLNHITSIAEEQNTDLTSSRDDIDLTQSPNNTIMLNKNKEKQASEELDLESPKHDMAQKSKDNENKYIVMENMDLTQSSNSLDELPLIQLDNNEKSLDDTIILDENEYKNTINIKLCKDDEQVFDLSQEQAECYESNSKGDSKSCSQSFFEEYVHVHSDHSDPDLDKSHNVSTNSDLNNIDLTQSSNSSQESNKTNPGPYKTSYSSLGRNGDVSIDYDEICNEETVKETLIKNHDDIYEHDIEVNDKVKVNNDIDINDDVEVNDGLLSQSSQNEVFEISDKELDYSINKSRQDIVHDHFDFGGISILDNISGNQSSENNLSISINRNNISDLPFIDMKNNTNDINSSKSNDMTTIKTPNNTKFIVKTNNVTPMLDYASMTTPQRNRELDRYGLKPFKRKRAIQILTHLYNQTHPIITPVHTEDQPSPKKQKKTPTQTSSLRSPVKQESPRKSVSANTDNREKLCVYEVTSVVPDIRNIECHSDDWVFQKREKAKVHSCRLPLHIAFHNYVSSRRGLREAILKYEPINIDVIHKDLVGYGHRYDPKDLLRFLDKKCITVKTTENNSRNNKR